jgi:hypothetical protein
MSGVWGIHKKRTLSFQRALMEIVKSSTLPRTVIAKADLSVLLGKRASLQNIFWFPVGCDYWHYREKEGVPSIGRIFSARLTLPHCD